MTFCPLLFFTLMRDVLIRTQRAVEAVGHVTTVSTHLPKHYSYPVLKASPFIFLANHLCKLSHLSSHLATHLRIKCLPLSRNHTKLSTIKNCFCQTGFCWSIPFAHFVNDRNVSKSMPFLRWKRVRITPKLVS
jgi:hypothetical protein